MIRRQGDLKLRVITMAPDVLKRYVESYRQAIDPVGDALKKEKSDGVSTPALG